MNVEKEEGRGVVHRSFPNYWSRRGRRCVAGVPTLSVVMGARKRPWKEKGGGEGEKRRLLPSFRTGRRSRLLHHSPRHFDDCPGERIGRKKEGGEGLPFFPIFETGGGVSCQELFWR